MDNNNTDTKFYHFSLGNPAPELSLCLEPLGMEDEVIPNSAITASTEVDPQHRAPNARLHFKGGDGRVGAWAAGANDKLQWLQVSFGNWTKVAGVAIQGRHTVDQWVESFTISFSFDGLLFKDYQEQAQKKVVNIFHIVSYVFNMVRVVFSIE